MKWKESALSLLFTRKLYTFISHGIQEWIHMYDGDYFDDHENILLFCLQQMYFWIYFIKFYYTYYKL